MKCSAVLAFAAAILASAGSADAAGPNNAKGSQCFRSESYQDFRAVNDHAFNIRVNVNDYYRIELEGACPTLTDPDAVLITRVRGSDLICGPLDWDLRVRERPRRHSGWLHRQKPAEAYARRGGRHPAEREAMSVAGVAAPAARLPSSQSLFVA